MEKSILARKQFLAKRIRAHDGCLGIGRRRRTQKTAISVGELSRSFDPGISEWGNPNNSDVIYHMELTRGTETSKYPKEKKSIEITLVAASERVRGQTTSLLVGL